MVEFPVKMFIAHYLKGLKAQIDVLFKRLYSRIEVQCTILVRTGGSK